MHADPLGVHCMSAIQVEEVREPDKALLDRLMLQRDGCAGDVVFLVYSSVRKLVLLLCHFFTIFPMAV